MKNVFLIVITFLSGIVVSAQVEKPISKGTFTLGGNIGYSNSSQTSDNNKEYYKMSFYIAPDVGYFFMNHLVMGISPVFSYSNRNEQFYESDSISFYRNNAYSRTKSISIAPFAKYYFNKGIFFAVEVAFSKDWGEEQSLIESYYDYSSFSSQMYGDYKTEFTANSFGYKIGAGYAYFINKNISAEGGVFYQTERQDGVGETNVRYSDSDAYSKSDYARKITLKSFYLSIGLHVFL